MTRTILISGAASGLGAAFVAAYSQQPDTKIIAIDRDQIQPPENNVENNEIITHTVNVTSEASLNSLTETLQNQPIDLVIHSAGVRGLVPSIERSKPGNVAACDSLAVMNTSTLANTFNINAIGTFNLIRSLFPNLQLSAKANGAARPKVIVMSSRMGSIGSNSVAPGAPASNTAAGGAYAYRASKAAMNAIVRSFAVDVPEVAFVLCHPGRVETKIVKWKEEGAIPADESVKGLLPLIEKWGAEDSGKFYDRFGETIIW